MVGTKVLGIVQDHKPTTFRNKDMPSSSGAKWKRKSVLEWNYQKRLVSVIRPQIEANAF